MFRSLMVVSLLLTSTAVLAEPRDDINKLVATYGDSFARKDAAGIASLYAKDGVLINANGVNADILRYYEAAFKNGMERLDGKIDQVVPLGEAVILSNGETQITGKNPTSGEAINATLVWTAVSVQEGGQWKIRMLTALPKAPSK
ncbi:MAG TPA: nuclear transport factor 2 family protein [Paraburkholderia sp.]|jgi:uncharacterized protein (TIGR02246 family)|nr:nuclear transport factor 2 family protein [Paraburkholderia sp.]